MRKGKLLLSCGLCALIGWGTSVVSKGPRISPSPDVDPQSSAPRQPSDDATIAGGDALIESIVERFEDHHWSAALADRSDDQIHDPEIGKTAEGWRQGWEQRTGWKPD